MYLPNDLSTILQLMIEVARNTRDFWQNVMNDSVRADQESRVVWTLMSLRDAARGSAGGYIGA